MNLTEKFRFKKPEANDFYNVDDFNSNMDIIEEELINRPEKTGDASQMTVTLDEKAEGEMQSGDTVGALFGKVQNAISEKVALVIMEENVPVANRKEHTFYLKVTDKQTIGVSDTIKVSPNMGVKLVE